jgi:hypothetical protein
MNPLRYNEEGLGPADRGIRNRLAELDADLVVFEAEKRVAAAAFQRGDLPVQVGGAAGSGLSAAASRAGQSAEHGRGRPAGDGHQQD